MLARTLFIYVLSFTVGIGAISHAKTQLSEQGLSETPEYKELAYVTRHHGRY